MPVFLYPSLPSYTLDAHCVMPVFPVGAGWVGWRHLLAVLAFFGFFSCMSQRVAFNISLVAMVNTSYGGDSRRDNMSTLDECPRPANQSNTTSPAEQRACILSCLIVDLCMAD